MRRYPLALFVSLCLTATLNAQQQSISNSAAPPPNNEPLRTAGDRPIDIQHLKLQLAVDLPNKSVDATATLTFTTMRALSSFTLDAVEFEVKKVELSQIRLEPKFEPAKFRHDGTQLTIDLPKEWPTGTNGIVSIQYVVRQPRDGLFFFGPTKAEPDIPFTLWSQGEAITNRYWIPCLDHPDEMQTTELIATVPDGYEVLSNGQLLERKANDNKTITFHWKQKEPHVSYLITLVVGKFAVVEEKWNGKPVLYYVPPERKDDAARTFGRTREMMDFFSKRFGIAYPWEKYAQVTVEQFTSGGMENTSATTLTQRSLHDERAFLDSDADSLIAHELAHQWWGDMVTCRDWSHLWLNEGWASFCEVLWYEHKLGIDRGAYHNYLKMSPAINGGKDRPIVDRRYPNPDLMFDARAYPKGAWVLHMLRAHLGEETFWKGVQYYGTTFRHQSVETADFRRAMEKVSGQNLERFFFDWTERAGAPLLEVTSEYLSESKQVRIAVKQTQPGEPFTFPLQIAVGNDVTQTPKLVTIQVREKEQVFFTPAIDSAPAFVMIDPNMLVLASLGETKGRDWWKNQLLHSKTIYPRIKAAQYFGKSKLPGDRELLAQALAAEKFWGVQLEITNALGDSGGDSCRDALIAGLKSSEPKVRRACADQLGKFRRDETVGKALKELLAKGDPSYFVEATACRAYAQSEQADALNVLLPWLARPSHADVIRVAVLDGLGNLGNVDALDTLLSWTKRGKSRESRIAALLALPKLAAKVNLTDVQRQSILTAMTDCLTGDGEMTHIRRASLDALRALGQSAASKLDVIEAILLHDPDDRVKDRAKLAINEIRTKAPVPTEVNRLRDELEKLRKLNQVLGERLEKMERKGM